MNALVIQAIDTSPLNRGLSGAAWVSRSGNVPITFDNGDVALFDDEGDGTYEVHFLFQSRGKLAIQHAKEAFRQMFTEHGAEFIFGLTPVELRHARIFNRLIGGKSAGLRSTRHGVCELFTLSNAMWKGTVQ